MFLKMIMTPIINFWIHEVRLHLTENNCRYFRGFFSLLKLFYVMPSLKDVFNLKITETHRRNLYFFGSHFNNHIKSM